MDKCPRQDPNNFKTGDIYEIECPSCGKSVKFFKDEDKQKCPNCGETVINARIKSDESQ